MDKLHNYSEVKIRIGINPQIVQIEFDLDNLGNTSGATLICVGPQDEINKSLINALEGKNYGKLPRELRKKNGIQKKFYNLVILP